MLLTQLALGSAMIVATAIVHTGGLVALIALLMRHTALGRADAKVLHVARYVALVVLAVFLLHAFEIWIWAVLYMLLGEFEELARALYFSTTVFTTLGFGDVVLTPRWQLLSSMEAANGIILFGLSTALLFAIFTRLLQRLELGE
jgi:voltage-gated potassium channel